MTNDILVSSSPSRSSTAPSPFAERVFAGLVPLVLIVYLGYFAVCAPLAALSLQLHDHLGFGTFVVGLIVGSQALATILTRHPSGALSDRDGPRRAVMLGLPITAGSGLLFLASTLPQFGPTAALLTILLGRLCMGLGESLFITGAMAWGMSRVGPTLTSKVMAWQGIGMYAALATGAPAGLAAQHAFGFNGVALLALATPLLAMLIAIRLPAVLPSGDSERVPFYRVVGLIWRPGLVQALATAPFAAMAAFIALDFSTHGWSGAGIALSGFGGGYILVRLFFADWPNRYGGVRIASGSLVLEAAGQALLWMAPNATLAIAGACITGLGFSLIFPAMGVEAVKQVAPEMRGRAIGNFMAFFDVAIGVTPPVIGLAVGIFGYPSAFLIGTGAVLLALVTVRTVGAAKKPG